MDWALVLPICVLLVCATSIVIGEWPKLITIVNGGGPNSQTSGEDINIIYEEDVE